MANKVQLLDKLARNLKMLGFTYTRGATNLVVDNGANPLTVSYVDADILKPMGGIDPSVNPFLGIGVANPGKMLIKSAAVAAGNLTDVLDSEVAANVFHLVSGFANNIILQNGAAFSIEIHGNQDNLGLGQ